MPKWTERASTDAEPLRLWFGRRYPHANLAIATGEQSGVFVLDVDGPRGEETLQHLMDVNGTLPQTLTAITGRGRHLYFNHPGRKVRSGAGYLGAGLDVRGDGGSAILPPSLHISGAEYRWEAPDQPIAEAPSWLIGAVCGERQTRAQESDTDGNAFGDDLGDEIPEGTRNETFFKIGSALRGQGCEREEIEEILTNMNEERCVPRMAQDEVRSIVNSVANYPKGQRSRKMAAQKKKPLWWFPFDVNEFCTDPRISGLTDYQLGWWIRLRAMAWKDGGYLPNDSGQLARVAGAQSARKFKREMRTVMKFFDVCEDDTDRIVDPELRAMWEEKLELVEKNREAGQQSALKRRKPVVSEAA